MAWMEGAVAIAEQSVGEYRVLAPQGRLVMSGPAEELE